MLLVGGRPNDTLPLVTAPGVAGEVGPPVGELEGPHRLVEGGEPVGVGVDVALSDQADLGRTLVGEAQPAFAERAVGGIVGLAIGILHVQHDELADRVVLLVLDRQIAKLVQAIVQAIAERG